MVVHEILEIIIILNDKLRFFINIYGGFDCETTLFIAFFVIEKNKVLAGIEPAMSRPTFSQFVEPFLAEMGYFR